MQRRPSPLQYRRPAFQHFISARGDPARVRVAGTVGAMPIPWCWLPSCFSTFMPVQEMPYPPGSPNGFTLPFVPAVASPTISPSL
jgi:hypothetical protein